MTGERTHDELIQEQFSRQAANWDTYVTSGGNEDALAWCIANLDLRSDMRVLDVATGTGLMARAVAPYVAEAVGVDVTPEMVAQAAQLSAAEGLNNVSFDEGDARGLLYPDGSFSLVICRLAMHQVDQPLACLREMVRVCRSGGEVVVIDITSSEDAPVAETHNRLERLRDPSHGWALSPARLREMAEGCGLRVARTATFEASRSVLTWMDMTETPSAARSVILEHLRAELGGGPPTGMYPYEEDGELKFTHRWVTQAGRKP